MICIFSNKGDHTTTEVMRWLYYMGDSDVLRVNSEDNLEEVELNATEQDITIRYKDAVLPLNTLKATWYRKGSKWLSNLYDAVTYPRNPGLTAYVNYKLKEEQQTLSRYIHYFIGRHSYCLGDPERLDLNKLIVLDLAQKAGLLIPSFLVGNSKEELIQFAGQQDAVITKAISDGIYFFEQHKTHTAYFTYTESVTHSWLEQLPQRLSPSLLQQGITKKYELRVFYLEGACYAMAICSQGHELTRTDFRKHAGETIQRMVPFTLPSALEERLISLFRTLGLNTGSADLLVDDQEQFYFLEINPAGQFEMVSQPCNYYLPQKVAQLLLEHERSNPASCTGTRHPAFGFPHPAA